MYWTTEQRLGVASKSTHFKSLSKICFASGRSNNKGNSAPCWRNHGDVMTSIPQCNSFFHRSALLHPYFRLFSYTSDENQPTSLHYVCVCVCMEIYLCICTYICTYIFTYIYIYIHTNTYVCVYMNE